MSVPKKVIENLEKGKGYEQTLATQIKNCLERKSFEDFKKIGDCVDIALSILQGESVEVKSIVEETETINDKMMGLFIED